MLGHVTIQPFLRNFYSTVPFPGISCRAIFNCPLRDTPELFAWAIPRGRKIPTAIRETNLIARCGLLGELQTGRYVRKLMITLAKLLAAGIIGVAIDPAMPEAPSLSSA